MADLNFKGFGLIDGTKDNFDPTTLENGYLYFIRTDSNGENGYIYFYGKKYGNVESNLVVSTTYSELKTLRDSDGLSVGTWYRITDYETTVYNNENARAAGHPFDILVLATDVNQLSEYAKAVHSARDTDEYFAEVNLDAWELKYCLDNDTDKFGWADPTNGKGVIYWLKDEWNNECPYDFKNIQFKRVAISNIEATGITSEMLSNLQRTFVYDNNGGICYGQVNGVPSNVSNYGSRINYTFDNSIEKYYYTFTWVDDSGDVQDVSIVGQQLTNDEGQYSGVFNNQIQPVSQYMFYPESQNSFGYSLNNIVFVSSYSYDSGFFYGYYGNKFGVNCHNNTFGNTCNNNTFGNTCNGNTFGDDCNSNTFGNYCNTNIFGNSCNTNIFGNSCSTNTFGNSCSTNTFGNSCDYNIFGNDCDYNEVLDNVKYITAFERVMYVSIGSTNGTVQYAQILNGTKGTSSSSKLKIDFAAGKNYTQIAGQNSAGELKIWVPADMITST